MSTKGDWPRPPSTGREERELRKKLFYGEIDLAEFEKQYEILRQAGKITRNGRRV